MLAFEQQIERARDEWVIEAQQRQLFARERGRAFERDRLRAVLQTLQAFGAEVFRIEHERARRGFLVVDAELLEEGKHEIVESVRVGRAQRVGERVLAAVAFGRELEQSIAAGLHELGELALRRARFGDQRIDLGIGFVAAERVTFGFDDDALAVAAQDLASIGRACAERIEAFVVPAQQRVLRGAAEDDCVQRDVVALADAVEPADALFEQVRIERQIPQDQVMRELEVPSFRADLGAQQHARAVCFGEPRGIAIALQDAHAFVEARDLDARARA